jgi:hypothetical protein
VALAAVELAAHRAHPSGTVPYSLEGPAEYRALDPELEAFGAARVSVVGSSRTREALVLPLLRLLLAQELPAPPSVASYAIGGAHAAEVELIVRKLHAAEPPPEIVLYGLTPRQLLDKGRPRNSAYLWDLADWWEDRRQRGASLDRYLPQVLRNELARASRAYRFREEVREALRAPASADGSALLRAAFGERDAPRTPLRGDLSIWQREAPHASWRMSPERVRAYVDSVWDPGLFTMERQEARLDALLARCREAGTAIALFEVPIAPILREHLPEGVYERFLDSVARAAHRHGVAFHTLSDLGVALEPGDFLEHSHLNSRGATKLTEALARRVAPSMPRASGRGPRGPDPKASGK